MMNLNKLETHKRITISGLPGSFPKTNYMYIKLFNRIVHGCIPRGGTLDSSDRDDENGAKNTMPNF